MSIQNYATAEMVQSVLSGETPPEEAKKAEMLKNSLTVIVNGETAGSFDGSSPLELALSTGSAVVEQVAALPEASEASADIVGVNGETYVKRKSGEVYSYTKLVVCDASNIAVGTNAAVTAPNGTAIGVQATAAGGNTIAMGRKSMASSIEALAIGSGASATSVYTVALGKSAFAEDNYAVAVGRNAQATAFNSMALGNEALAQTNNTISLGNADITVFQCQTGLSVTSDERDKAEIEPLNAEKSLAFIERVQPVRYVNNRRGRYVAEGGRVRSGKYDKEAHRRGDKKGDRKRVGVLAQQVQKTLQELFHTDNYADIVNDDCYFLPEEERAESILTVRYGAFIPFLIGAVQALSEKVCELEEKTIDKPARL